MRKIVLDYAEQLAASANADKLGFLDKIITLKVKPELEALDNVTFIEKIADDVNLTATFYFDIELENMLLFYKVLGSNSKVQMGIAKKESKEVIKSYDCAGFNYTTSSNFHLFIGTLYFIVNDNKLNAIYTSLSTGMVTNSTFFALDVDNFGKSFIALGDNSMSAYYGEDENYIPYTLNNTHINNYLSTHVWMGNAEIISSSSEIQATTTNLLKICSKILSTDIALSGQLIDVDGIKYRKLNYCWWIKDTEEGA